MKIIDKIPEYLPKDNYKGKWNELLDGKPRALTNPVDFKQGAMAQVRQTIRKFAERNGYIADIRTDHKMEIIYVQLSKRPNTPNEQQS